MTTPTPEQFLAAPSDAEEDGPQVPDPWSNPVESIAWSLRELVGGAPAAPVEGIVTREEYDELAQVFDDLEDKHRVLFELVEEVESIIKPSTSKLANTVRDAIGRWKNPAVPAEETAPEPEGAALSSTFGYLRPEHDATVEEWRDFARKALPNVSLTGDLPDVDSMNRSQIRTMLGIEQPVGGEEA